ncbi:MAG TPA: hypothetical protein VIX73_30270, partial [Kofleriaceae bacterium]
VILRSGPPRGTQRARAAVCTGSVAVRAFSHAVCTCDGYATSTALTTDSFDSAAGPYAPGGTTGDVAIDGDMRTNALVQVGGGLVVASAAGAALLADLHVAHDLAIAGPTGGGGGVTVTAGGNAEIAGNVDLAALSVAGTLTIPPGATLAGTVTAGATQRAAVSIAPPCACGDTDIVDVAGLLAVHASDNQDAAIGLAPDRFTDYHGAAVLDLPCGIYYLGPVRGDGELTLRITGRVALLVDGDISLRAPLTISLDTDDAELDLIARGILSSDQAIVIGRADHPARTRIYLAGTGTTELSGNSQLSANLYAPNTAIALSATASVHGSLFVRRLDQSAPLTIHYDIDVRRADIACPP